MLFSLLASGTTLNSFQRNRHEKRSATIGTVQKGCINDSKKVFAKVILNN